MAVRIDADKTYIKENLAGLHGSVECVKHYDDGRAVIRCEICRGNEDPESVSIVMFNKADAQSVVGFLEMLIEDIERRESKVPDKE